MKKWTAFALALTLTLICAAAMASTTSILRQENAFGINFTDWTGSETHAMRLEAGNVLTINASLKAGSFDITVKDSGGTVLYTATEPPEPGFELLIPEDGVYRIVAHGMAAQGHLLIKQRMAGNEKEKTAEGPRRRSLVEGSQGYIAEYDPDVFTFVEGTAEDRFEAIAPGEGLIPATIALSRIDMPLDEKAAALLLMDGSEELEPSVTELLATRTIRVQTGTAFDSEVRLYTLVEMGENEVFSIRITYSYAEEEDVLSKAQAMIASLHFTR